MSVARGLARLACDRGQAAVEVLGLVPLVGAVALAAYCAVAAHTAGEQAGAAAEAGAVAILQDRDPRAAARAALPAGVRPRASVDVHAGDVRVRVSPLLPLPGAAAVLAGEATASAGIRAGGRGPAAAGAGIRAGRRRAAAPGTGIRAGGRSAAAPGTGIRAGRRRPVDAAGSVP